MAEMTISEAAATLGISPETVRRRARSGELPARKDGRGRYLVDVDAGLPPASAVLTNGATLHAAEVLRLRLELDRTARELEHREELLKEARQRAERAERESDRLQQQLAAATVRELQLLMQDEIYALASAPELQAALAQGAPAEDARARPAARPRRKRWWQLWRHAPKPEPEPTSS